MLGMLRVALGSAGKGCREAHREARYLVVIDPPSQ
jgi:hypothetical protein